MAKIDFPVATVEGQVFNSSSGVKYTYVGTPPDGYWSAELVIAVVAVVLLKTFSQ